ncbi:DUF503 domain-containing protein [SAR202 cluster bacterium AD-804-J14_MRT_500m]|nr:DUF503 domain-containing protein [SAR202 cluster bacterium AD-804-J14_MRT_500m]
MGDNVLTTAHHRCLEYTLRFSHHQVEVRGSCYTSCQLHCPVFREVVLKVALCRIHLRLQESFNLKDKRRISQSLMTKVRSKFNVAIAEVEDNDRRHWLTLGVSYVSNDGRHANQVISKVVDFVDQGNFEGEMVDYEFELLDAF